VLEGLQKDSPYLKLPYIIMDEEDTKKRMSNKEKIGIYNECINKKCGIVKR